MSTGAEMTEPRIIEVGEVAAGIVVRADSRHVRFHAAETLFERLDGRLFRGAREVTAAAAALLERRAPRREPTPETPAGSDRTGDLILAAYGPFRTL